MRTNSTPYGQPPTFDSLDQIQMWILASLLEQGQPVTSRKLATLEPYPLAFTLQSPRGRCIINPERRWNMPLAIGEFCWHATGSNALESIEFYAPRWKEFAEGPAISGSCYGHHIFHGEEGKPSQWKRLVNLLRV